MKKTNGKREPVIAQIKERIIEMTIQEIYNSLSDALVADKSPATEYALNQLQNLHNNAIIVMEHNGRQHDDYADGVVDVVFSEGEAKAMCAENPNRFYYTRKENGKFFYN